MISSVVRSSFDIRCQLSYQNYLHDHFSLFAKFVEEIHKICTVVRKCIDFCSKTFKTVRLWVTYIKNVKNRGVNEFVVEIRSPKCKNQTFLLSMAVVFVLSRNIGPDSIPRGQKDWIFFNFPHSLFPHLPQYTSSPPPPPPPKKKRERK